MARLFYSSWFGGLGGGELRLLDHIGATAFGTRETFVILGQDGELKNELEALDVRTYVNRWKGGSSYIARQIHWGQGWWSCLRRLRAERPHVVVCNTIFDLESTGKVAASLRLPLVWRARADTFPNAHRWSKAEREGLVGFLNSRVDAIAATTRYEAAMMLDHGVRPQKVHVIHNGVNLRAYAAADGKAVRRELGLLPDTFVISFVARMVPQKGYDVFFDALGQLAQRQVEFTALVAGDTTLLEAEQDQFKRSLMAQLSSLGIEDRVRLLGFRKDVPAIMAASDVFAMSSRVEPFGNTIIEAMAAGRPVVCSDLPGPRESMEDGVTGLMFEAGSALQMAAALETLRSQPVRRKGMGDAARRRVEERFDLKRNIAALDSLCVQTARAPAV